MDDRVGGPLHQCAVEIVEVDGFLDVVGEHQAWRLELEPARQAAAPAPFGPLERLHELPAARLAVGLALDGVNVRQQGRLLAKLLASAGVFSAVRQPVKHAIAVLVVEGQTGAAKIPSRKPIRTVDVHLAIRPIEGVQWCDANPVHNPQMLPENGMDITLHLLVGAGAALTFAQLLRVAWHPGPRKGPILASPVKSFRQLLHECQMECQVAGSVRRQNLRQEVERHVHHADLNVVVPLVARAQLAAEGHLRVAIHPKSLNHLDVASPTQLRVELWRAMYHRPAIVARGHAGVVHPAHNRVQLVHEHAPKANANVRVPGRAVRDLHCVNRRPGVVRVVQERPLHLLAERGVGPRVRPANLRQRVVAVVVVKGAVVVAGVHGLAFRLGLGDNH
mmetsp:Transcript_17632/g.44928  ORF Transcript_17632/g.44928 Transcript_17632/m.44928 type:complete len:391 (-) Transcript_17632:2895-4067(-)